MPAYCSENGVYNIGNTTTSVGVAISNRTVGPSNYLEELQVKSRDGVVFRSIYNALSGAGQYIMMFAQCSNTYWHDVTFDGSGLGVENTTNLSITLSFSFLKLNDVEERPDIRM